MKTLFQKPNEIWSIYNKTMYSRKECEEIFIKITGSSTKKICDTDPEEGVKMGENEKKRKFFS